MNQSSSDREGVFRQMDAVIKKELLTLVLSIHGDAYVVGGQLRGRNRGLKGVCSQH